MGEELACIAGVLLALYGAVNLLLRLNCRFLFSGYVCRPVTVIPILGHCGDAEYLRYCLMAQQRLSACGSRLVLVNCDLDEEERKTAQALAEEFDLLFCNREELGEILKTGLQAREKSL